MSNAILHASREHFENLAKNHLQKLRQSDPQAKLGTALQAVARDHGFSSWRALKADVELRRTRSTSAFFDACVAGNVKVLTELLAEDPGLVRQSNPDAPHPGWMGLHSAAEYGHVDAVGLLLDSGADPNAREGGDNTYPLHWAAAQGHIETARALVDGGGDVYGAGDAHELDVIGRATLYRVPSGVPSDRPAVTELLLERGAQHHIFSAIAVGELDLIQKLVETSPAALDRRMSRFERKQTSLHFAMGRGRYDIVDLLIDLGADVEAEDGSGLTPLADAMLRGDRAAMSRLHAAGAKQPRRRKSSTFFSRMAKMARSVRHSAPMIRVPDVAQTFDWYKSLGFKEVGRDEKGGQMNWGLLALGSAELMLTTDGEAGPQDVSLWFYSDEVDRLYELFKSRQFEVTQDELAGRPTAYPPVEFAQHINEPFYGGREFAIRDLNGYILYFRQPSDWLDEADEFEGRFTRRRFIE